MPVKILCLDDSVTIQQAVAITFLKSNYEVTPLLEGSEVLKTVHDLNPALILLDARLEQPPSWEVYEMLEQDAKARQIPLILLGDAGANSPLSHLNFIPKPFTTSSLFSEIHQFLTRKELEAAKHLVKEPLIRIPMPPPRAPQGASQIHELAPASLTSPLAKPLNLSQEIPLANDHRYELEPLPEAAPLPTWRNTAEHPLLLSQSGHPGEAGETANEITGELSRNRTKNIPTNIQDKHVANPLVDDNLEDFQQTPLLAANSTLHTHPNANAHKPLSPAVLRATIEQIAWDIAPNIIDKILKERIALLTDQIVQEKIDYLLKQQNTELFNPTYNNSKSSS